MKTKPHYPLISCFLLSSLFSIPANSATPEEDPVVAKIQEDFLSAPPITMKSLRLDKPWGKCKVYSAAKGDFSVVEMNGADDGITFTINKNVITNQNGDVYIFMGNELMTDTMRPQKKGTPLLLTVHIKFKKLIAEYSTKKRGLFSEKKGRIVSPARGSFAESRNDLAVEYVVCTAK